MAGELSWLDSIGQNWGSWVGPLLQFGSSYLNSKQNTDPKLTKEGSQLYDQTQPLYQQLMNAGMQGMSPYPIPDWLQSYQRPSMQGVLSGAPMYDIPNANMMMPSSEWYGNISGDVMKGVRAPWEDASNQLNEQLFSRGQAGSARAGVGGAAAAGQGEFWSRAGQQMGQQAWSMTGPQMMQNWQAQLDRSKMGYQNVLQERGMDYQNMLQQLAEDYAAKQQYRGETLQGAYSPYTLAPGFLGGMGQLPSFANPANNPWASLMGNMGMQMSLQSLFKK